LLSREGKPFYYAIDDDGRVFVSGEFKNDEDEIIFNINPYVAELPLKFRPFLDRQGPIPAERLIEEQDPVEEKPKRRKANRIKKSESTE